MSKFILSCSSTADLTKEQYDARDIHVVCFHYSVDDVDYTEDFGQTYSFEKYFEDIAKGAIAKSSQINIAEYVDFFTELLEKGDKLVHLSLSSGISGTCGSAKSAASIVNERFPDKKVYVIDSLAAAAGFGLLVDKAADLRDEGLTAEEAVDWLEANKKRLHHWFFSTDLTCFVRGGRISKAAGVFGGALQICPLMNVDFEGKLIPRFKVRTKKKVIPAIVNQMELHAEDGVNYSGKVYLADSACREDAQAVAALIEAKFPNIEFGSVQHYSIGNTIGAHTGKGTVALFFWGDERVD